MKDFTAAVENAAARFTRYTLEYTPAAAASLIRPVLHTLAYVFEIPFECVKNNFECALLDYDENALYFWDTAENNTVWRVVE